MIVGGRVNSEIPDGCSRMLRLPNGRLTSRELTYPTFGKGKSSTQKCFGKGYVSSQEGVFLFHVPWVVVSFFCSSSNRRSVVAERSRHDKNCEDCEGGCWKEFLFGSIVCQCLDTVSMHLCIRIFMIFALWWSNVQCRNNRVLGWHTGWG